MTTIAKPDQHRGPRHHLRLRPRRAENLARFSRTRGIAVHGARPRPRPRAPAAAAGQSVVFGDAARLQSLMAAGLAAPRGRRQLRRHGLGAEDPAKSWRARAEGAGDRAHDDDADLERAGRRPSRARGHRGNADAGQPALALVGVPMRRVIRLVQDGATHAACCAATSTAPTTTPSKGAGRTLDCRTITLPDHPGPARELDDLALHATSVADGRCAAPVTPYATSQTTPSAGNDAEDVN